MRSYRAYRPVTRYIFFGRTNNEVKFSDVFVYHHSPSIRELNKDLENYIRAEGAVYDVENHTHSHWTGTIEPLEEDDEYVYDN